MYEPLLTLGLKCDVSAFESNLAFRTRWDDASWGCVRSCDAGSENDRVDHVLVPLSHPKSHSGSFPETQWLRPCLHHRGYFVAFAVEREDDQSGCIPPVSCCCHASDDASLANTNNTLQLDWKRFPRLAQEDECISIMILS